MPGGDKRVIEDMHKATNKKEDYKLSGNNFNQRKVVHTENSFCRTIIGSGHAGNEPKVVKSVSVAYDEQNKNIRTNGDVGTIITDISSPEYRIRKLTPKECWRLQGFTDECFERAKWLSLQEAEEFIEKHPNYKCKKDSYGKERVERISDSQLYKQAGNTITVDVLYYIFKELYKAMPYLFDELKVGSYFSGIGAFELGLDRLFESINSANFTQATV